MESFKWHPDESPPLLKEHSKAKLTVLRSYLRAYFDRLGANFARDTFKLDLVDGFAGGGTFQYDNTIISGTPLIMLEESKAATGRLNRNRSKPMRFDFKHYFIDKEAAHTDHLRKVLNERRHSIDNKTIIARNSPFKDAVDSIIAEILRRQPRVGRSIFLLDQCGFSQVDFALIARILRELPAAEVILTFATDVLINFLSEERKYIQSVAPINLTESQIDDLIQLRNGDGGRALVQRALRDHVRTQTGATYDTPFFIRPEKSRRALWFLHLSRHPTARDVMIQCHWNNGNTFEHYGPGDFDMLGWDPLKSEETLPLFRFEEDDAEQMRKQLLNSMPRELFGLVSETPVTVDAMRHMFANRTAARFSDLDETVLKLAQGNEFEILSMFGKVHTRSLKQLMPTDRIALPRIRLLTGISRHR